jgi:hypothetical protein
MGPGGSGSQHRRTRPRRAGRGSRSSGAPSSTRCCFPRPCRTTTRSQRSRRPTRGASACSPRSSRGGRRAVLPRARRGTSTPRGHASPPHTTPRAATGNTCRRGTAPRGVGRVSGNVDPPCTPRFCPPVATSTTAPACSACTRFCRVSSDPGGRRAACARCSSSCCARLCATRAWCAASRHPTPRRRALAVAWLTGTLDDQVVVPVGFVCDALGLDAGVLAAAVRARAAP